MERIFGAADHGARLVLIAPFAVAALAAMVLIQASLLAAGAADEFGYPAWAPTLGGLIFAVPTLAMASFFAWRVWLKTGAPFRVRLPRAAAGAAAVLAGTGLTLSYVMLVGNPESYRGRLDSMTLEYEPMYSLESFLGLTALMALTFPMAGVWFLARIAFLDAVQRTGRTSVEGVDPIGELIRQSAPR